MRDLTPQEIIDVNGGICPTCFAPLLHSAYMLIAFSAGLAAPYAMSAAKYVFPDLFNTPDTLFQKEQQTVVPEENGNFIKENEGIKEPRKPCH